jgi:hypothetical protein
MYLCHYIFKGISVSEKRGNDHRKRTKNVLLKTTFETSGLNLKGQSRKIQIAENLLSLKKFNWS